MRRGQHVLQKQNFVSVSEEVAAALSEGRPVVALESTIISHGMPYPRNIEVATSVEDIIRKHGGIPATCAIISGVPKVGLSMQDLEILGHGHTVLKASRRDLGLAIANKAHAATTVAGTMILANAVGISVFATGGIGGVHRGVEHTMDISADLFELGRTPVAVVCAGVKSILDIPRTLEVLESQGVPVIGYQCDEFPAFFTNHSSIASPIRLNHTQDIARLIHAQRQLQLTNGLVVGVPNPSPADETIQVATTHIHTWFDYLSAYTHIHTLFIYVLLTHPLDLPYPPLLQLAVDTALANATRQGISGASITPFTSPHPHPTHLLYCTYPPPPPAGS